MLNKEPAGNKNQHTERTSAQKNQQVAVLVLLYGLSIFLFIDAETQQACAYMIP